MKIRPGTRDDVPRLRELTKSRYDFAEYLALPNYQTIVVEDGDLGVVGLAVMHIWRWNRSGQISELFVDPRQRSRGYGTRLLRELQRIGRDENLRTIFDIVSPAEPGLQFYLRCDFAIAGYNAQYFDRPDPAARTGLIVSLDVEAPVPDLAPT